MDDNYRAKLDEGMDDLLKGLEGEAREKGDYCQKHDLYIGDAKMCPWCEIDALNEKCSPGDLKASVVATWPMAARRAMMYFQVAEGDAADEIERLRAADSAKSKYIKELREDVAFYRGGLDTDPLHDAREANKELKQRIEELEKESEWKAMKQLLCADYHIIPRDKIDLAWEYTNAPNQSAGFAHACELALGKLGIVRRGEGWVIK